jgi:hypothetical protein
MQILSLSLAAALAMSAEAFVPMGAFSTRSLLARSATAMQASDKPLTELCEITKEACDVVSPMLNGECLVWDIICIDPSCIDSTVMWSVGDLMGRLTFSGKRYFFLGKKWFMVNGLTTLVTTLYTH